MKKVLSILVAATMVVTMSTGSVFADPGNGNSKGKEKEKISQQLTDIGGHWGKKSIEDLQSQGILDGYSDGTFKPDKTLTQGELAVIISRLLEIKQGDNDQDLENDEDSIDDNDLADVPAWAKDAVSKGFKKNYLNLKRFHSQEQCNRLYACVAIAKALKLDPITEFSKNPFKDMGLINDEDYGYLLAFYKAGYIKGYPDGNFNPNNLLTRAQIATIIDKLLNGDGDVINDDNEPTWDSNATLEAKDVEATSLKLEWSGADDDVAVVGYKVLYELNGTDKVKYSATKSTTITGLDPDEKYEFTVQARDAAGNWSDDGPSVTATTDEAVEDTQDPSWTDESVTATAIRVDSVDLKWSGATDDVKVVAYKVTYELNDTTKTKYFYGTTGRIGGLEADEEYTFTVEAKDAAGNWSDDGPSVTVTTLEKAVEDTADPTWPHDAALDISESDGVVTVEWPDAEDNVGVTAYRFYKDGQLFKTLDNDVNKVRLSGLDANTEYTFKVKAVDAAGNLSDKLEDTYTTD